MLELLTFEDIYMAYIDEKVKKILHEEQQCCEIDGIPVKRHLRCTDCGILIGPGHVEETAFDDLCSACARLAARKER